MTNDLQDALRAANELQEEKLKAQEEKDAAADIAMSQAELPEPAATKRTASGDARRRPAERTLEPEEPTPTGYPSRAACATPTS